VETIYKYVGIDNNTFKLLESCKLFFNDAKNFNDPFDSYIRSDFTGTIQDLKNYYREIELPEDIIKINIADIESGKKSIVDCCPPANANYASMLKISCFSDDPDNILLWAHYAKGHSGICVGFKVYHESASTCMHFDKKDFNTENFSIFNGSVPLWKINYKNMSRSINRLKENQIRVMEFLLTKGHAWSYEKEYRLLIPKNMIKNNPIRFSSMEITDILFGMNTTDKVKQKILTIIHQYPSNGDWINVYQAKREQGKYGIVFIKL
jgi:hypothetical protein